MDLTLRELLSYMVKPTELLNSPLIVQMFLDVVVETWRGISPSFWRLTSHLQDSLCYLLISEMMMKWCLIEPDEDLKSGAQQEVCRACVCSGSSSCSVLPLRTCSVTCGLLVDLMKEVPFHVHMDKPGTGLLSRKRWKTDNWSPGKSRWCILELMAKTRFLSSVQVFVNGNSPVFQD